MVIGIDASRAFLKKRTGIEEYAYQTIKHLRQSIDQKNEVVLYVRKKISWKQGNFRWITPDIDFSLPKNWQVRGIWAPRFWTQIGLSLEMFFHRPDILFVPAHTIPLFHPRHTIVTIHGLEYEFCKGSYAFLDRLYMRLSIRFSCFFSEKIICVSENTKRDVMKLYGVSEEKIRVIYEGYEETFQISERSLETGIVFSQTDFLSQKPYILFIGRLEERKNVTGIIRAFEKVKEKYTLPHTLILVGKPGYKYSLIQQKIQESTQKDWIREMGYVTEKEKWEALRNADVFVFPSLYEGFGIPLLEAQSVGVPLITSCTSSLPEVGGEGAIYVDSQNTDVLAESIYTLVSDKKLRDAIIEKGTENVRRFSWQKCADAIYSLFF